MVSPEQAKTLLEMPEGAGPRETFIQRVRRTGHSRWGRISGIVLFTLIALVAGFVWAWRTSIAVLAEADGRPERDFRATMNQWVQAAPGDEFFDGDGAQTGTAVEARFELAGQARLTLKPSSRIRFNRRTRGQGTVGLTVELGAVDVRTEERQVSVASQFGDLTIEPRSLIRLSRTGERLAVAVAVGALEVIGPDGSKKFGAGQTLELQLGGLIVEPPAASAKAAPEPALAPGEPALDRGDGVESSDLPVTVGTSVTVHDPAPPVAIGFRFAEKCDGPGTVTVGRLHSEAIGGVNLRLPAGHHRYELRCRGRGDAIVSQGMIDVLRDPGTRPLPSFAPTASVDTDGRHYTVLYQAQLPRVTVRWPSAPQASSYQLLIDGAARQTSSSTVELPAGALRPGQHTLAFRAATTPARQSRPTAVTIQYDHQAPLGRVQEPAPGFEPGGVVNVTGQALPGWSVSVNGSPLDLDGRLRFSTKAAQAGVLVIQFSHPERGVHYYLRRARPAAP